MERKAQSFRPTPNIAFVTVRESPGSRQIPRMRKHNTVGHLLLKRFVRSSRIPIVRPPEPPHLSIPRRWKFGSALNGFAGAQITRIAAALVLLAITLSAQ